MRQTGRTTRMLIRAIEKFSNPERPQKIVIVVHNANATKHCIDIAMQMMNCFFSHSDKKPIVPIKSRGVIEFHHQYGSKKFVSEIVFVSINSVEKLHGLSIDHCEVDSAVYEGNISERDIEKMNQILYPHLITSQTSDVPKPPDKKLIRSIIDVFVKKLKSGFTSK